MIAIRLNPFYADVIDDNLNEISKHPGCCDEVWLAMYSYEPLENHRKKAEIMGQYIDKLTLVINNPVSEKFVLSRPCIPDESLTFEVKNDKIYVKIPPLAPWATATVRAL